jgi:hypothetical protein
MSLVVNGWSKKAAREMDWKFARAAFRNSICCGVYVWLGMSGEGGVLGAGEVGGEGVDINLYITLNAFIKIFKIFSFHCIIAYSYQCNHIYQVQKR